MIKNFIFKLLALVFPALLLLVMLEGVTYILFKSGKIQLIEAKSLAYLTKVSPEISNPNELVYVPHPYFGYVYYPNDAIDFASFKFKTNSNGFMDSEFPTRKEKGICVYGLAGGSGAMSWGIEKREERISSQLEKLLNQNGKTDECKSYRVLNLGIGSQHQYQATLIFQFYKYLLDGIIFMGGHNECYQGAMLDSGEPVRFPIMNIHNTIQIPSPVKFEIAHLRKKLRKQAQVISEISFFKISFIAKYIIGRYFTSQTQKLDKLSFKLENEGKEVKFELPHFKDVRLQPQFPDFDLEKFLYSDVFEKSMGYDGKNIMTQVLKVVYVEPLKDAWHLAKNEGIKFMWAIQPLLGAVDKQKTSQEKYFISRHPMLQKSCHEALSAVSADLEKYGLKKYDLNRLKLFNSIQGNAFLDYVHLNPAGAKAVAEFIFNQTVNNWSEKAKQ